MQLYCNRWIDIASCLSIQGLGFLKIKWDSEGLKTFYNLLIQRFLQRGKFNSCEKQETSIDFECYV